MHAVYAAIPWLTTAVVLGAGLYGVATSRNFVHLVMCLAILQSSTYLLLLSVGYRAGGVAPIFTQASPGQPVVDPVVQALMLTDIVVEATVMALLLALAVQAAARTGSLDPDHVREVRG